MTCEEVRAAVGQPPLEATAAVRLAVAIHYRKCAACRQYLDDDIAEKSKGIDAAELAMLEAIAHIRARAICEKDIQDPEILEQGWKGGLFKSGESKESSPPPNRVTDELS